MQSIISSSFLHTIHTYHTYYYTYQTFTFHLFVHIIHFYHSSHTILHTIIFYTLFIFTFKDFYIPSIFTHFIFTYHLLLHTIIHFYTQFIHNSHTIHTQFTHNTLYSLFSGMKTRIQRSKTNVFSHMKELKEEALSKEQDCYKLNNGIRIQEQNKKVRERNDVILRIVQEYEERERLHYLRAIANQFNIKF